MKAIHYIGNCMGASKEGVILDMYTEYRNLALALILDCTL